MRVLCVDCGGIVCGLLWFCVRTVAVLCADRCGIVCGPLWYCVRTVAVLCADCCGIVCRLLRYCVHTVVILCSDCCGTYCGRPATVSCDVINVYLKGKCHVKTCSTGIGLDSNHRPHMTFTFFSPAVHLLRFF